MSKAKKKQKKSKEVVCGRAHMNTYLLNVTDLESTIKLDNKAGLISIRKTDGGEVIINATDDFQKVGQNVDVTSLLAFFLKQGLRFEKVLTYGGNYIPHNLNLVEKKIRSNHEYDADKFEKYYKKINSLCNSRNTNTLKKGLRMNNMLKLYNDSLIMAPKFYDESYLNFMRILDFQKLSKESGAKLFPYKVISNLSGRFINDVYKKMEQLELYQKHHIPTGLKVFGALRNISHSNTYNTDAKKMFFATLYAAYEYRSKFVHDGFSFPYKIKFRHVGDNEAINYYDASFGEGGSTNASVGNPGNFYDSHDYLNKTFEKKMKRDFKKLYLLLPKWYFMNLIVREVISSHLKKL